MRKTGRWILIIMALVMLGACNRGNQTTGTPTNVPTVQPTVGGEQTETPSPSPAVTQTPTPPLTVVPTQTPTPEPTELPKPSVTPEPTEEPDPTVTPEPTEEPDPSITPEPTEEPDPSVTPEPTGEPEPSVTPQPVVSPAPTPDPESFVNAGWQRVIDISEQYYIIFPECFDTPEIERYEKELLLSYSSTTQPAVCFYIRYTMEQTVEQALEQIALDGGYLTEQLPEEKQFSYRMESDIINQGIVLETSFPKTLLDSAYEAEEKIQGTIQIALEYPREYDMESQAETYRYFLVPIP